jgi:hypothetical protein
MGISQLVHQIKPQNVTTERPGRVGPVGETRVRPRFRQSCADMPVAYDPYWSGKRAHKLGSNVQDGYTFSYTSKGGPAESVKNGWNGNRSFKTQYGYTTHDVRPRDLATEPITSELPQFSWRRKVGALRIVKAGSLFMPMGYQATGKPRGGLYPTSTTYGGINPASERYDPEKEPAVDLGDKAPKPDNLTQAGPTRIGAQRLGQAMDRMRLL